MKISELKLHLSEIDGVRFKLPDGNYVAFHSHLTEIGLVTRHFIDCGGTERKDVIANFQLWQADDYEHRLTPRKFQQILERSQGILGSDNLEIEVEYQQNTIGKFGLGFDGTDFLLINKHTACLAEDACGIPQKKKISLSELSTRSSCCAPESDCC